MVPWYLYVGFIAFVLAMLLVDLKMFHAEEHDPTPKESGTWVAIWVSLALVFGGIVFLWKGASSGAEYFAGYLIEYSLSVDNMFVFVLIFSYFKVPFSYQHQVLFYGILGALIFRGIFIALGVTLINNFEWVIYVFGLFLIFTAGRLALGAEEVDPEHNSILRFLQKHVRTSTRYDQQKFFTIENGKKVATPLLIVLLFIEMTDIVFAIDSIPAIFGITTDPFIILTSNVFAILGLRALYFLLADIMGRFHLLKFGLAFILGFVGVKMLIEAGIPWIDLEVHVPIWLSLAVIVTALLITGYLSLKIPPKESPPRPPKGPIEEANPEEEIPEEPPEEANSEEEIPEEIPEGGNVRMNDPRLEHDRMIVRQLIRPMVNVYEVSVAGPDGKTPGQLVAFVRQKRLRLKEEIRFFADADQREHLFSLKARRVIEFGGHYDVVAPDGTLVGTLHKKGKASLLRSTWEQLGPDGQVVAWAHEKSAGLAIFRRIKDVLPYGELIPIPYHFVFHVGETPVGQYSRIIGLRDKYLLDLTADTERKIDRRVAIAQAVALDALQAR